MCAGVVSVFFLLAVSADAAGQSENFRWASHTQDNALFDEVTTAFQKELMPDRPVSETGIVPRLIKGIDQIGLSGNSALVIIRERENKEDQYPEFEVFNYDLVSKAKSPVLGRVTADNEKPSLHGFTMLKIDRLAHFISLTEPDVVFAFSSCSACEAERYLASFHHFADTGKWQILHWGQQGRATLFIGGDNDEADGDIYSFDCLHYVGDLNNDGLDDAAVRCRESVLHGNAKSRKRIVKDETFLYTAKDGKLHRVVVSATSGNAATIQQRLCTEETKGPLCRAPR
jgi:hypothetical protein